MIDNPDELRKITYTVSELLKADKQDELYEILNSSEINIEETGYDNWDGGTYFYTIFLNVNVETFVRIRDRIEKIETELLSRFEIGTRHLENQIVSSIRIVPKAQPRLDWKKIAGFNTKDGLLKDVGFIMHTMISVSTGGQRIQEINDEYKTKYQNVDKALQKLNLQNPNPFKDLWDWYGKWSADFSTYRERRAFIREMFSTLVQTLEETEEPETISVTVDLTGWERIERSIQEINMRHNEASKEEQFQVVGLLCRETIITLAQSVYSPEKHPILDGTKVSTTDAKRMLEAYIAVELAGSSYEKLRKYAKATLDLANELTHKRTATKKDSSLCSVATISLINFIGTIEGRI
ncbi:MAG: hypothetical protein KAR19_19990 [Bacteroidales bacterium]|nr:hypothetical protein [Bacteroidales bacterium]